MHAAKEIIVIVVLQTETTFIYENNNLLTKESIWSMLHLSNNVWVDHAEIDTFSPSWTFELCKVDIMNYLFEQQLIQDGIFSRFQSVCRFKIISFWLVYCMAETQPVATFSSNDVNIVR